MSVRSLLPVKPEKATREYVLGLLAPHLLDDGTGSIVEAVYTVLVQSGRLTEVDGHVDITDRPGATLLFPADAQWQMLCALRAACEAIPLLGYIVVSTIVGGCGIGSRGTSTPESRERARAQRRAIARENAERMAFDRAMHIASFGDVPVDVAERLFNFILDQVLADAGPPIPTQVRFVRRDDRFEFEFEFAEQQFRMKQSAGLNHVRDLLQNPGVEVRVQDLDAGTVVQSLHGDVHRIFDDEAMDSVHDAIRAAQAKRSKATNAAERDAAEKEIVELKKHLRKVQRKGGKSRTYTNEARQCRDRVGVAIDRALKQLENRCPALAAHLRKSIRPRRGWNPCYHPDPMVVWTFE